MTSARAFVAGCLAALVCATGTVSATQVLRPALFPKTLRFLVDHRFSRACAQVLLRHGSPSVAEIHRGTGVARLDAMILEDVVFEADVAKRIDLGQLEQVADGRYLVKVDYDVKDVGSALGGCEGPAAVPAAANAAQPGALPKLIDRALDPPQPPAFDFTRPPMADCALFVEGDARLTREDLQAFEGEHGAALRHRWSEMQHAGEDPQATRMQSRIVEPVRATAPASGAPSKGTVSVIVAVDASGKPDAKVRCSTDERLHASVLAAVAASRFEPFRLEGKAYDSTLEFSYVSH